MKKQILFVNSHLYAGGVERSLVDVLRHLDYNKFDVDLLLLEGKGDYIDELPPDLNIILRDTTSAYGPIKSVICKNIQSRNWFGIKYRLSLLLNRIIGVRTYNYIVKLLGINKRYDSAIAYRIGSSADIIAYGVKAEQKICWWHHGAICEGHDTESWIKVWRNFDKLVAVSSGVREILADLSVDLIPKLTVIPNMVDAEQICAMGDSGDNPYLDKETINFVTVGRIVIEKHIENVVEVAICLRKDGRLNFKWFIVGDGELYDDIAQHIQQADIADRVILCGRQANPYPYIKYADMMVHTSHIESQGLVIQEAMALGTPCVITRSVGPSGFVVDGKNGVMVEPTVESLVQGIYRLAESPELRSTIIANGHKTLQQGYTPKIVIEKIEKLIQ